MDYIKEIICLLKTPEYIALLVSVVAIVVNVYISNKNRKNQFAKEEYFKLQQIAEQIVSKLLILDHHREALAIFFEKSNEAEKTNSTFLDTNNTFDKSKFETNSETISAYLEIYFPNLKEDYNTCLVNMGKLFSSMLSLAIRIKQKQDIKWEDEKNNFNDISKKIGIKPKEISNNIIDELKKYREKNL